MVKRNAKATDQEPDQKSFDLPSEKEHLFQCTDVFDMQNKPANFEITDPDIVYAKLEVVGGEEEGRTILNRLNLDDSFKGFFATRLFLKAIGEPYKGSDFQIDTENWVGRQFYATVVHNGKYANIKEYNFEKLVDNHHLVREEKKNGEEIAWDEK